MSGVNTLKACAGLLPAEAAFRTLYTKAPAGTDKADVCLPAFWMPVAASLREGDEIRIDGPGTRTPWVIRVIVVEKLTDGVLVRPIMGFDIDGGIAPPDASPRAPQDAADVDFQYGGEILKWQVVRKSDGHVLKSALRTEDEARGWFAMHLRTGGKR